ncbi:hypothetical protein CD30_12960 [Ureibacillus massiliensis 4400831 = CIP 108448 = CCUG 49529]|uniref:Tripartite ATP-independent periplasmic transporters DctQ component domain-containing protein n=1 Tax=Ureibacillus massiliensis 4400831 = CIP 108448 = CCUG 49529 TaxID=1211035 RepID=A0A0A3J4Q9_9BACL|nr:TRAP transporter small permease subunit [Ureibacillus massiliensis]KGR90158.1 hypothetical protein CD30_12960 [Ureibacillus massiliensis 4400831 = CIP 108448 = CCUG 49529]
MFGLQIINNFIIVIDKISDWVGKICSWSIILLTFLIVFEVISRRVFNSPTIWTYEVITIVFGFHFMLVAAYALLHKSLVSVDLLYSRLSRKTQAIMDIFTYTIFFFPFVIFVFSVGFGNALDSWSILETSSSLFGAPVYITKTVVPLAFGLLLLQGISELLKKVQILVEEAKA